MITKCHLVFKDWHILILTNQLKSIVRALKLNTRGAISKRHVFILLK